MIELRQVCKTFTAGAKDKSVHAVRDVSLTIADGEIFGIIGFSGAGKSTLVRCINLLERPTSGSVTIDGQDLMTLSEKDLRAARKKIGMIFQHFNLMNSRTVFENVAYPLLGAKMTREEKRKKVMDLLEIVGLADKEKAYPSQLSGGQKQRVAIARALANDPSVLLCDEATSALDPQTTASILALLKEINRKLGITIVIITHEMTVVESTCTHVAIIDDGLLAETGPVEEVFANPKSPAAKKLIFRAANSTLMGERMIRIVFEGSESQEPVISDLVLACHASVNILHADIRNVNGKTFGQMILRLPEDKLQQEKIVFFLTSRGLRVEEVNSFGH